MLDWFYIAEARALKLQLTHEGTLFGVPAYFAKDEEGEIALLIKSAHIPREMAL